MIVTLPWPDRRLSPNARLHWRAKVGPKQQARIRSSWTVVGTKGYHIAKEAVQAHDGPIALMVTFYPPDARRRDDDNMIGAFKAHRDGIADAMGVDDHRFKAQYKFADPCKPGRVEVEFL